MADMRELQFPPGSFAREDEGDDAEFYVQPRKVVHLDETAIASAGALYAVLLPPGEPLLDLMSSWRTHLPGPFQRGHVVGLGMNAEEMADNPQLDEYLVHDLNKQPEFPFADERFGGVICTVSVQYMTQPMAVFQEVNRILWPGGPFIVTFSNRCFPPKAVAIWKATSDQQHLALVRLYFEAAGGWTDINTASLLQEATAAGRDPLYAVWARKARR